jgi:hypothetical protein
MRKPIFAILVSTSLILLIASCKKEDKNLDEELYNETKSAGGFIYYKGDNTVLQSSTASPHLGYFRVRYNASAYSALTDTGKLPVGGSFPEGSIVVKELYTTLTGELKMLAVMKKSSKPQAGEGWLWSEYNADGSVVVPASEKGKSCISCHSTNARDYNRLFDLFP